jgi:2Fe-2S ferredoxin
VTYRRVGGSETTIDGSEGLSVMQAALANGISGIVAECGGALSCATCHVYVEGGPVANLPPVSEDEDAMLESTVSPRTEASRLSCQLPVCAATDGLVVTVAPEQL